jgi:hypothetical protein
LALPAEATAQQFLDPYWLPWHNLAEMATRSASSRQGRSTNAVRLRSRRAPAKAGAPKKWPQYLVDEKGQRTAVVLPIEEYEELVEALEQLDDVRHLEKAKAVAGQPVPWEHVKAELRAQGKLP